jgi:uncharacterized protein YjbI with pentapeptide repeats
VTSDSFPEIRVWQSNDQVLAESGNSYIMCNHSYTAEHFKGHRSIGQRCPYPEFYEKVRATNTSAPETESALVLPIDDRGACIFHSRQIEWKRRNDFKGKFLQLLQLLDTDKAARVYDFAEFVFAGNEIETKGGSQKYVLHIADTIFCKQANFIGASFVDSFVLERVDFQNGAEFKYVTFDCDLRIENTRIRGSDFNQAKFMRLAIFTKVEFLSYALFTGVRFTGISSGYTVKFEDSRFQGITDFSGAVFALGDQSTAAFQKIQFEDCADFTGTQFNCHINFSDVIFTYGADFIDTKFDVVNSAARYRGAAVEFKQITVMPKAVLNFISTDPQNKLFNLDVQMSFKEEPTGIIQFENVNFNRITLDSKERLMQLAKLGRVQIGSGCIKYRFQTDIRTIAVDQGNAPLIIDICQTFTNYFTVSSGFNLGFEIVERAKTKISFFYFTDENISETTFLDRLAQTEQNLWNLLSIRSNEQLLAHAEPTGTALVAPRESAVINAVDGISTLLGTFFRVAARIAFGVWKEADTKALLGAIRFNEAGADDRALLLHKVLVDKYTGQALFVLNGQQNALLPPIPVNDRSLHTPKKIRILFLAANSWVLPLDIENEVKNIQINLKLARERDNLEFKQEWAVTIDTLTQALFDESPTIVHFSGHSDESGIILQDDAGQPKVVPTDALSDLFKLFKDTVQCVVLNSCYSEPQARAIRRHIPYVIGSRSRLPDTMAVAFSSGFYKALGAGRDIPFAFNMGKVSSRMEGVSSENILVLL